MFDFVEVRAEIKPRSPHEERFGKRQFIGVLVVLGNDTSSTTIVVPLPQGEGKKSTDISLAISLNAVNLQLFEFNPENRDFNKPSPWGRGTACGG